MGAYRYNGTRDAKIVQEYLDGDSFAEIAHKNDLSRAWVGNIIRRTLGDAYVRTYKTSEKHRATCNKNYKKGLPQKPVKIDPEEMWRLGHLAEARNAAL